MPDYIDEKIADAKELIVSIPDNIRESYDRKLVFMRDLYYDAPRTLKNTKDEYVTYIIDTSNYYLDNPLQFGRDYRGASEQILIEAATSKGAGKIISGLSGVKVLNKTKNPQKFANKTDTHPNTSPGELLRKKYPHLDDAARKERYAQLMERQQQLNKVHKLRQKYEHINNRDRRERISELILQLEEKNYGPRSHFYAKHGAQTTLAQQQHRSITGIAPNGQGKNPVASSRFFSHNDQLEVLRIARARYKSGMKSDIIDMQRVIGVGYEQGGQKMFITTQVQVYYGQNGEIITLYPKK